MKRLQFALPLALLFGMTLTAHGQMYGSGRHIAPRPTISPWLDLQRGDNDGPLDNYHTFVRPRQRAYNTLGRQNFAIQQQGRAIRGLGNRMSQMRQTPSGVRPTGTHSTFMNYSHYFPSSRGR